MSILKPNRYKKLSFRKNLNVDKKTLIIGNIARYSPMKDHENLISSLSLIKKKNINFLCILIGTNIDKKNTKLIDHIKKLKLTKHIKLYGIQKNVAQIMNGLDIYVQSSSYGEGFPNVVAEAMTHEIPCIATNVGDASHIVGNTGWIVPPKNSLKLALAIENAFLKINKKNWKTRCKQSRVRIEKNFNIFKMINDYSEIWSKVYNQKLT